MKMVPVSKYKDKNYKILIKYHQKKNVDIEIPGVGVFSVRNGVAAVHFDEFLAESIKVRNQQLFDTIFYQIFLGSDEKISQ